jgi:hypothetical protein
MVKATRSASTPGPIPTHVSSHSRAPQYCTHRELQCPASGQSRADLTTLHIRAALGNRLNLFSHASIACTTPTPTKASRRQPPPVYLSHRRNCPSGAHPHPHGRYHLRSCFGAARSKSPSQIARAGESPLVISSVTTIVKAPHL